MARYKLPFSIIQRADTPYIYFKLPSWPSYRSTGTTSLDEAQRIAEAAYLDSLSGPAGPTLRQYAAPFYIWEKCPHTRRLLSEGKSITKHHVRDMRSIMRNHIFADPIADMVLPEIRRAHIPGFWGTVCR